MANPSKDRGTRWESACAAFLRAHGFPEVYRMAPTGEFDAGDLGGISTVAFECRDRNRMTMAEHVDDANKRAKAKGTPFGIALVKRRGRTAGAGYAVMDIATLSRLLLSLNSKGVVMNTRDIVSD